MQDRNTADFFDHHFLRRRKWRYRIAGVVGLILIVAALVLPTRGFFLTLFNL